MLITRPAIGKLTDRYGVVKVSIPALLCNVLSFFIISYAHTIWSFLLAAFIAGCGYGACQPAIQALSMKAVPIERRGSASSTNFIGMDLGNFFGPAIGGFIAQFLGYHMMWRFMAIPFLVGMFVMFLNRSTFSQIEESFASK